MAVQDEKRSKLWLLFVMGYFSLLLSLSILYHLDHSSFQFCLIWGGGLHSSSLRLTLGAKCFGFSLVLPFPTLADHSCPLPDVTS